MMYHFFKRILDLVVAMVLMVVFLPVWLIVPLLVVLTSKGPVLYKHRRLGKDGKEFDMYKFRSMVVDADEISIGN